MSNRIFKNYQVNLGLPFQVRIPRNFDTIKKVNDPDQSDETEEAYGETPEDMAARAREEAGFILQEARTEASRIIDAARSEAERNRMAIEEQAGRKGYEDGFNTATKQYEEIIREAESYREQIKVEYREILESMESDVINMILDIARKIICTEVDINKENVLFLVRQGIERCSNKDAVVLKVSVEDYDFLVSNRDRLLSMLEGVGEIEIKKDFSLKAGGCLLETAYGNVDAGIQTKLRQIEEAFLELVGRQ